MNLPIVEFVKSSWAKIAAVLGAATAIAAAWPMVKPYTPVVYYWLQKELTPISETCIETALIVNDYQQQRLQQSIGRLNAVLKDNDDPNLRAAREQVERDLMALQVKSKKLHGVAPQ